MARKPKIIDSSLITNDVLRPWTIDIHENEKLQIETSALDIVLTYTTPQKFAGTLGISPLDARPKGYQEFEHTLNDKLLFSTLRTTKNNNNNNNNNNNYNNSNSNLNKNRIGGDVFNLPVLSPSRNESGSTLIQQAIASSNRNNNTFPSNRDKNMNGSSNGNPATNTNTLNSNSSMIETDRLKFTLKSNDNCRAATAVNSSYYTSTDNYHKSRSSSNNKNNHNNSNKQILNTSASFSAFNATNTTTSTNSSSNAYIDKIYDDHDLEHIDQLRHLLFLKTSKSKYHMTKIKSMTSLEEIRYIGSPDKAVKSPYSSKLKLLPVLTNKMKNKRIERSKTNNA